MSITGKPSIPNGLKQVGIVISIPTCFNVPPGPITGEWLQDLDRDEVFVREAALFLGMPAGTSLGGAFCCPLHDEQRPSASFGKTDDGYFYFRDWHMDESDPCRTLTVAELYAATKTGRAEKFGKSRASHAIWKKRLLCDMDILTPIAVPLPALPLDASATTRKVYAGIRELFGVRWLTEHGVAAPLTWRFTGAWCGVADNTAQKAIQYLLANRIIRTAGTARMQGKAVTLFLPGHPAHKPRDARQNGPSGSYRK